MAMRNQPPIRRNVRFAWAGLMLLASIVIGYAFSALGLGDRLGFAFGCFIGGAIWFIGLILISSVLAGRPK
jgi:hypothetical protein